MKHQKPKKKVVLENIITGESIQIETRADFIVGQSIMLKGMKAPHYDWFGFGRKLRTVEKEFKHCAGHGPIESWRFADLKNQQVPAFPIQVESWKL